MRKKPTNKQTTKAVVKVPAQKQAVAAPEGVLFQNILELIESGKRRVFNVVNAELVHLYWGIGKLIKQHILQPKRAGYGERILISLAKKLTRKYGAGWSEKQLRHCLHSAETFSQKQIVSTVRRQLGWSHLKIIAYLKTPIEREFYIEMCAMERWSTRVLQERVDSMLFERTAISKKPEITIKNELAMLREKKNVSPDLVFKDPYLLHFLGLADTYNEKDLESSLVAEIQRFIIELGSDFAFIGRQKRITIDSDDYYIDLLFYHRRLRRLVAIDLKLGKFKPAYKGQMELYLNWLDKYERADGEESPIGLILCADKSDEHIELLTLNKGNIRVAQFFTELPAKKLLKEKFHKAIANAKSRFGDAPRAIQKKR